METEAPNFLKKSIEHVYTKNEKVTKYESNKMEVKDQIPHSMHETSLTSRSLNLAATKKRVPANSF